MSSNPSDEASRSVRVITILGGGSFVIFGLWAFAAPSSFFEVLATFDPYNAHFVRDIGAFQLGLGTVLILSLVSRSTSAVALGGAGVGAAFHAVGHVIDRELGGSPGTDIPTFAVLAVVLLVGAWLGRERRNSREEGRQATPVNGTT